MNNKILQFSQAIKQLSIEQTWDNYQVALKLGRELKSLGRVDLVNAVTKRIFDNKFYLKWKGKTMKVSNMTSSNGNKIANQFEIFDGNYIYFQSYDSIIDHCSYMLTASGSSKEKLQSQASWISLVSGERGINKNRKI